MGQLLIRQIDDEDIERLKARAKALSTSVEALAREAVRKAARLTGEEKQALVRKMLERGEAAKIAGVKQTPGWVLIREDRDHDH